MSDKKLPRRVGKGNAKSKPSVPQRETDAASGKGNQVSSGTSGTRSSSKTSMQKGESPSTSGRSVSGQVPGRKQLTSEQNKGIIAVQAMLEQLRTQSDSNKYDEKVFKKSRGTSDVDLENCQGILKDICSNLKIQSEEQSRLEAQSTAVTKLCEKLKNAYEEILKGKSDVSSQSMNVQGMALGKGPPSDDISKAEANADKLIEKLRIISNTSNVKSIKNDRLVHEAEERGKAKVLTVNEWLIKLEKQIENDEYDVKDFKDKGQEETKKCHKTMTDICNKLKNKSDALKSVHEEVQNLEDEIKEWNNVKKVEHSAKTPPYGMAKTVRTCRLQLFDKKRAFSENEKKKGEVDVKMQEKHIKKILKTVFPDKPESESMSADTALDEIEKYFSELRESADTEKVVKEGIWKHAVELWKMTFSSADLPENDKKDVIEILNTVTVEVKNLREEIQNLDKEIKAWENVKEMERSDKFPDGMLKTMRTCRLQLLEKKKERSGNDTKEREVEVKRQEEKIKKIWKTIFPDKPESESKPADTALDGIEKYFLEIKEKAVKDKKVKDGIWKHAVGLWKMAFGSEDFPQTENRRNDGIEILKSVTNEVKEIEIVTSKLEEACYEIHNNVLGNTPAEKGELRNSLHVLRNNLHILQTCKNETGAFVENFSELEKCFAHEVTTGSITNKCKAMIKTAKSFQVNVVKKEEHDRLKESQSALRQEMNKMATERDSALLRLSKVAGARLTDNNPNIADLSDPNRPTKLAEQFSEVYDNQWTDAFESLSQLDQKKSKLDEKKCIGVLLHILLDSYNECGEISLNHLKNLKRAVSNPVMNMPPPEAADKKNGKEIALQAVQSKALSDLRKQCVYISVSSVETYFRKTHTEWFKTKALEKYTIICIQLCWLMHAQSPPIVMHSTKQGSPFNTSMFRQYTKSGKQVDFLVWPALLLEEDGAVLCKGVAQAK